MRERRIEDHGGQERQKKNAVHSLLHPYFVLFLGLPRASILANPQRQNKLRRNRGARITGRLERGAVGGRKSAVEKQRDAVRVSKGGK